MERVTIIVPFYNVELYIEDCLVSLTNQTFRDIEILCIDDCSPDGSLEIVQAFAAKDDRIKIIKHELNKGLGGARNTGINHAVADYICFVDSDDYVAETFVEKLYQTITNDGSDMAICGFWLFEDGVKKTCHKEYDNAVLNVSANNVLEITKNHRIATWLKLYKRELIVGNSILQPEKQYYEDVIFWLMAVNYSTRISVISDRLYYYRIRSDSIMTTISYKHIEDRFKFIARIYDFVKNVILKEANIDAHMVSSDLLSNILDHLCYGRTLVDGSVREDAGEMCAYYDKQVASFAINHNWQKLLVAYNERARI